MPDSAATKWKGGRWTWAALPSGAAVACGCLAAAMSGVPAATWGRNAAAWLIGVGLAFAMAGRVRAAWVVALTVAALGATLLSPGLDGVHRWIRIGPIFLNAALLLLPATVVAITDRRWPLPVLALLSGLLASQPDASQACALAAAALLIFLRQRRREPASLVALVTIVLAAGMACRRPDPLPRVPEVEDILSLAWIASPMLALAAVAALAGAVLAPLALACGREGAAASAALLAVTSLAPLLGNFPVPLVGMGLSPILGYWLAIGMLIARARATPQ